MVTTKQAVDAIARHIGFDPPRVAAVARRLTEAGVLPSGAPKAPPVLNPEHVVSIIMGSAGDGWPLHKTAAVVASHRDLTPAGVSIDALPGRLQFTAGNFLDALADEPENARHLRIEIVSTWPEIAIFYDDGTVRRFVEPGANPNRWQGSGHRRSTTINGPAFAGTFQDLFGGAN
ncbi:MULTISPECIES: hypothetical protein [unclassified Mesorhizobium]|uniref:hypothetical protein n=1 Tax=unclassified Mesorhizobium TaxID=325217 RepID=UPI0024155996|nr:MULTISPECIES: hypothetical protein [unclassified Mesorhizobium]MDG4854065.1 hypothetical protein [Mesorhizobium sp. WSM4982]MDG4910919.1 hypothetical protein [Mesorhizobium sp. WSM4983]